MLSNSSHLLLKILEEIGGATAVAVSIMERYNDFSGLVHLHDEPSHFDCPAAYFRASQAIALFKKCENLKIPGIDTRSAAIEKWWQAERQCYRSNERLSPFVFGSFSEDEKAIATFLDSVRKKIESWIGPRPPNLDSLAGRFGPGATFSDRGRLTTVPDKMSSIPSLTTGAKWYILPFLGTMWGRENALASRGLSFVRGNRFTTVPKNFKTDRGIAIEPAINVFYQLGLGSSLRRRLYASTGWNLDTAQEIHRKVAMLSSVTGEFATLDLSSASDTVCTNLVKLLLPPAWFRELDCLRSPFTLIGEKWVRLEKFSSMGNGYTFELETLIFAAIASAWLEHSGHRGILGSDLYVFGDDIIVPTDCAKSLISVLSFLGFTTNESKTFVAGPFRESCGGDFWLGRNVRPWFRKKLWSEPMLLIPEVNGLRAALLRYGHIRGTPCSFESWELLRLQIPLPYRNFFGPSLLGDSVIHSDESRWKYRWKDSIRLFRTVSISPKALPWYHWKPGIILASAVYGAGSGHAGVIPRDPIVSFRRSWAPSS